MTDAQMKARNERRKELQRQLDWAIGNPHKFEDQNQRYGTIDFIKGSIAELDKPDEMKKTLRPGKVRLRDRLRYLVVVIVSQTTADWK